MAIRRFDVANGWETDSLETLTQTDSPAGITYLLMHGNWMDATWTERRGWEMYHQLTQTMDPDRPIRYIIWSWPSDRRPKPLRTTRQNAYRADDEAFYFAWLLGQLPPSERIGLIGFSLGARVLSGGLHLLGGGSLRGRVIESPEPNQHGYRVAYYAGAVSVSSPTLYGSGQRAMANMQSLLNIYNPADPVLQRYHLVTQRRGDQAIGRHGIYLASPVDRAKVTQVNASGAVGREHAWDRYLQSPYLMNLTRAHVIWN